MIHIFFELGIFWDSFVWTIYPGDCVKYFYRVFGPAFRDEPFWWLWQHEKKKASKGLDYGHDQVQR